MTVKLKFDTRNTQIRNIPINENGTVKLIFGTRNTQIRNIPSDVNGNVKLIFGTRNTQIRNTPINENWISPTELMKLENERLKEQVDCLIRKESIIYISELKEMKEELTELHQHFIIPKVVTLTAKDKRKILVNNAIAKL
jgi:hypothetical protein